MTYSSRTFPIYAAAARTIAVNDKLLLKKVKTNIVNKNKINVSEK